MRKHTVWVAVLAIAMFGFGCTKKMKTNNAAQPAAVEDKNHGQERSEQAHEENAERKEAHDEAKADDKAVKADDKAAKDAKKKDKK